MSKGLVGSKADILRYLREQKAAGKIRGFTDLDTEKPKKNAQKKGKNIPKVNKTKAWIAKNLWAWCRANNLTLKTEFKFSDTRDFRFDWFIEELALGLEYEGVMSEKSRHTTPIGYSNDAGKYNLAQQLGYKVLRYTVLNYRSIISDLEKELQNENNR